MSSFYKDKIQFDEPKTLEEAIQKDKYIYDQNKCKQIFRRLGRIRRNKIKINGRRISDPFFKKQSPTLSSEIVQLKVEKEKVLKKNWNLLTPQLASSLVTWGPHIFSNFSHQVSSLKVLFLTYLTLMNVFEVHIKMIEHTKWLLFLMIECRPTLLVMY
jgi:hypothetical protein